MGNCMKSMEPLLTSPQPSISVDTSPITKSGLPIIFIIGGPGVGKRTLCTMVATKYNFVSIMSTDVIRLEVSTRSERAFLLARMMSRGQLVPTDVLIELITAKMIDNLDKSKGFIVSGFPRHKEQCLMFEQTVKKPDLVLFIKARNRVLADRMMARKITTSERVDMNFDLIKKRLKDFHKRNIPILRYYQDHLVVIDGEPEVMTVYENVCQIIDNMLINYPTTSSDVKSSAIEPTNGEPTNGELMIGEPTNSKPTDSKPTKIKPTISLQTISLHTISFKTISEETTSEETSSEQMTSEQTTREQTTREQTTREQTTSEQTTREQTTSDQTNSDQTNSDQTNSEQTTSDQTNSDQTNNDQTNSEQTTREQTTREQTTREQTTREQTTSDQANSEQTNSEQTNCEQPNCKQTNCEQTNCEQTNSDQTNSDQTNSEQTNSEQTNIEPTNIDSADIQPTNINPEDDPSVNDQI